MKSFISNIRIEYNKENETLNIYDEIDSCIYVNIKNSNDIAKALKDFILDYYKEE